MTRSDDTARGAAFLRRADPLPPLPAEEMAWCVRRVYELAALRQLAATQHRQLLARRAHRYGRDVGRGRTTLDTAERALATLVARTWPGSTVPLVPYAEATALVRRPFAAGLDDGHAELRRAVA